jgi:L-threonylcarbamoyladenylate synthase
MFEKGTIWAYPTDTSFGLGVRADDVETLERLQELKSRPDKKFFSLMVKDFEMLKMFAEIPKEITENFFLDKPRTVILKPTPLLPISKFWPKGKVAFRICTIDEIAEEIEFPVTATSANISGKEPIFDIEKIKNDFQNQVKIFDRWKILPIKNPSEIWDFTISEPKKIR